MPTKLVNSQPMHLSSHKMWNFIFCYHLVVMCDIMYKLNQLQHSHVLNFLFFFLPYSSWRTRPLCYHRDGGIVIECKDNLPRYTGCRLPSLFTTRQMHSKSCGCSDTRKEILKGAKRVDLDCHCYFHPGV